MPDGLSPEPLGRVTWLPQFSGGLGSQAFRGLRVKAVSERMLLPLKMGASGPGGLPCYFQGPRRNKLRKPSSCQELNAVLEMDKSLGIGPARPAPPALPRTPRSDFT